MKIAVLVSGGGTNLQALIDAEARGDIRNGELCAVISSNPNAYALERANQAFIPSYVLRRKEYADAESYGAALDTLLRQVGAELVVARPVEPDRVVEVIRTVPLSQVQVSGSQVTFALDYVPEQAGMFDMALRIFPQNPMLPHRMDFALVKWA